MVGLSWGLGIGNWELGIGIGIRREGRCVRGKARCHIRDSILAPKVCL